MELVLVRTYYPDGTNGSLLCNNKKICSTIELAWQQNHTGTSCIPDGRYALQRRYSAHLRWHLWLQDVEGRSLILIHPANNAIRELKGCIAPVTIITGPGRGLISRRAFKKVMALVPVGHAEPVWLTISPKPPVIVHLKNKIS